MPTIMNVVGARPQFIKAGPVSKALAALGYREILVHTGQHYDPIMSEEIMVDVGLRHPDINLGVGSGTHGAQTARMLEGMESAIMERRPGVVLTYGDTNSTVAAALGAAKLGVPTAHIEAGLRSFNRAMPEELNRVATDHLSDLLLAPTETAMRHLTTEGLDSRSVLTGDVMVDALESIDVEKVALPVWASGEFHSATLHRAENTDEPTRLKDRIHALSNLELPVHLLAHPRLRERMREFDIEAKGSLTIHAPLPYAEMLAVVAASKSLLTDSGGLQKEAFILGVLCVTLREETEWPETLEGGWNVLATEPDSPLQTLVEREVEQVQSSPFGDGQAANRVVEAVQRLL